MDVKWEKKKFADFKKNMSRMANGRKFELTRAPFYPLIHKLVVDHQGHLHLYPGTNYKGKFTIKCMTDKACTAVREEKVPTIVKSLKDTLYIAYYDNAIGDTKLMIIPEKQASHFFDQLQD